MIRRRAAILRHTLVILKHVIALLTIKMWNLILLVLAMSC